MIDDISTEEFLAHYGVKGMKWGVIRDKRDALREKSALRYEDKAAFFNTKLSELSTRKFDNDYQRQNAQTLNKDLTKRRDRAIDDASRRREGKLTSQDKKVIIGASIAAAVVTTAVVKYNVESGEFRRISEKGKEALTGQKFSFKKKPELANVKNADDAFENVVKGINPDFGKVGTSQNCRRCTFAYEMRRRGYDVAATRTTNANGQNAIGVINATTPGKKIRGTSVPSFAKQAFKEATSKGEATPIKDLTENFMAGAKTKIPKPDAEGIFEALSKQPNGSRGEVGVQWAMGGGHSIAYEVFNGKPVIFDNQSGKKYASALELANDGYDKLKSSGFSRLDNIELNTDYLMRWLKNAS